MAILRNMDYITANGHLAIYDKTESRNEFVSLRTTYFCTDLIYSIILRKQRPRDWPEFIKLNRLQALILRGVGWGGGIHQHPTN